MALHGARRDPRHCDGCAGCRYRCDACRRNTRATMVTPAPSLYVGTRGYGRRCPSAAKCVSVPSTVDITTLDPGYRLSFAYACGGAKANERPYTTTAA